MKPDYLFHIPGTHSMFDYDEIISRSSLPKKDPQHMKLPKVVEIIDNRRAKPVGRMSWAIAAIKFR